MMSGSLAKLLEQGGTLLRTEALHAPVVGDADIRHDSSIETTFSFPTLGSLESSASRRLMEPIFRRALISARAARASAAFASAAVRCSGVN